MALLTLLDIAKMNGADGGLVELLDEATRATPEISGITFAGAKPVKIPGVGASRTIKGTQYKTLVRTALPQFQFRNANEGVTPGKSTYENRLVETFIADMRWEADKAVADANEDGPEAVIAAEAYAIIASAMMGLSKQFYYGRASGGDAKGHPGLIDSVHADRVVDAGGTTAATASSVWGVKFGPQGVQWVWGNGASFDIDDPRIESVADAADATKKFTAYVQQWTAWAGVQVKSLDCVGRIRDITEDAGKGLTDGLLGKLFAKFPVGVVPDALFLSRRSLEQLRASRTATNETGREAPTPTEFQGVPLVPTDSILNTEALS